MKKRGQQKLHTSVGCLAKHHHLSLMAVTGEVALEAILVPTLLLTHLTVPSQFLQPF
jgi:hypothetical protein